MRLPIKGRPAFTIVELLVSMALILFILLILSEAFVYSVGAFSQLKAAGDLQEKLRAATTILRRDLQANHFTSQAQTGPAVAGTKLSSWDMSKYQPPDGVNGMGFFRVWEGYDSETDNNSNPAADTDALSYPVKPPPSPFRPEGNDDTGIPSSRAANHILHFTVQLTGSRPEDFVTARIPTADWSTYGWNGLGPAPYMSAYNANTNALTNIYFTPWAEVAYFLRPTNETTGVVPLYALYRRQFGLLTPQDKMASRFDNPPATPPPPLNRIPSSSLANYYDMSRTVDPSANQYLYLNGPDDATIPERRMFANQNINSAGLPSPYAGSLQNSAWYASFQDAAPGSLLDGDDLLLQDVISFEVKALYDTATSPGTDFQLFPQCTNNSVYAGYRLFDTWTSSADGTSSFYTGYQNRGWDPSNPSFSGKPQPTVIPLQVRVRALQIIIRVWDKKSQQTRQITVVQDM